MSLELVGGELEVVKKENEWVVEGGMLEIMIGGCWEEMGVKKGVEIGGQGEGWGNEIIEWEGGEFMSGRKKKRDMVDVVEGEYWSRWKGKKGEQIWLEVGEKGKVEGMNVGWKNGERGREQEIESWRGGGELVGVEGGEVSGNEEESIGLKKRGGSEVGMVISNGSGEIGEMKLGEVRKE